MSGGKRGRGEEGGEGGEQGQGQCEDMDRQARRFSPILNDEIHQGQGGLVGDSDSQVQGELSRCLNTHPSLSVSPVHLPPPQYHPLEFLLSPDTSRYEAARTPER